jgi:hypothetical protein
MCWRCIPAIDLIPISRGYVRNMSDSQNVAKQSPAQADLTSLEKPGAGPARADLDTSHASAELASLVLSFLRDVRRGMSNY